MTPASGLRTRWVAAACLLFWAAGLWPASAASLATLAKDQGNGSRFTMTNQGTSYDLHVGLVKVDRAASRAVIEVYAAAQFADPLWQQFTLAVKSDRPVVESGYIQIGAKAPMRMPDKSLAGTGSLDMSMFLLSESDLKGGSTRDMKLLGQEKISTPAGTVQCTHYRVDKPEQKLDFWVSDEAKPIGLVRMVSVGKKPIDTYQLELQELLSGIAPKINPANAVPLSDEVKAILSK